jgi:hypothetical protein
MEGVVSSRHMGYHRPMRKPLLLVFGVVSSLSSIACGPPYHMTVHAVPSPFTRPGCRAFLEPIHTEQLMVGGKPDAVYAAEKKAESADSYDADKHESDVAFHQRIMADHPMLFGPGAPDNTFVIRPVWTHWEPGFYAWIAKRSSEASFVVDVVAPNGQVLDRFDFETRVRATSGNPSTGGRMREALTLAGSIVGAYIDDNWFCAAH